MACVEFSSVSKATLKRIYYCVAFSSVSKAIFKRVYYCVEFSSVSKATFKRIYYCVEFSVSYLQKNLSVLNFDPYAKVPQAVAPEDGLVGGDCLLLVGLGQLQRAGRCTANQIHFNSFCLL